MADLIQFRRDTLERWKSFNPILAEGELGLVLGEANQYKIGDGVHAWNDLPMKGFNGNILEKLGDNYDAVISQHGISKLLKYIINNGSQVEIGSSWKIIDSITDAGVYIITRGGLPVHHMMVCWDSMYHQYNQWIFGNLVINSDGSVNGTHIDGTANIIHRSRKLGTTTTWSKWKYLQEYFLKEETGNNSHYSVSQKFFTETVSGLSDDMAAMEIELMKEFSSQNTQLQNAIDSLQNKFDNLNTRTDDIEDLTNTALVDSKDAKEIADKAFEITETSSASRFYGFINITPIVGKPTDTGVVKFNHSTNNFVYVVENGDVITAYSQFDGDNLFNTASYTRKNKVYINDDDLYVYDEAGNFIKIGTDYQVAIDILNQKVGAIIHCNDLVDSISSDSELGYYLISDSKGKVIRLVHVTDGETIDITAEVGYIIECNGLYYGWNGKLFNTIGGGSGSGSGSGFYNITKEHPKESGEYYTLATAVAKLSESSIDEDDRRGMIITFESSAGNWEDYRYIGTSVDDNTFLNPASWKEHGGKGAVKKITYSVGTNVPQELTPDAQGNVNLNVPSVEVIETVDPSSTNPPQSKAVAAELKSIAGKYGTALRLNTIGDGADKAFSITLLTESGEELSTTDMFTGGGGGGSVQATKIVLTRLTANPTVKSGDEVKLSYKYDHVDTTSEESTGESGRITVTISRGATSNSFTQIIAAGSVETLDVTKYIDVGTNSVRVKVEVGEDEAKQVSSISWSVTVVQLVLTSSFNLATPIYKGDNIVVPFALTGSGNKTLRCYVDGVDYEDRSITASSANGSFTISSENLNHGAHSIQLVAELLLTDGITIIKSNSIYFGVGVRVSGNTTPIISMKFDYKDGNIISSGETPYISVRQYEDYEITFAVYNPVETPTQVDVYELGSLISSSKVSFVLTKLNFRAMSYGTENCKIVCDGTEFNFNLISEKSDLELEEPTDNMVLKLNAQGRSNGDTNRDEWTYGDVTTTMSGFNYGGDGWTGLALRHKGKARSVVNFKLFQQPNLNANNALAFLIKYKVTEVSDYDTPVISCIDENGTGFEILPTEVRMVTRGNSKVSMKMAVGETYEVAFVSFPEYVEGASEYEKQNTKMLYLYIDGKASGGVQRGESDSVYQLSAQNISIGSNGATTDVYLMRAWNSFLTADQVLACDILDRTDVEDLLSTYNENDILNDNGDIAVENVPDGMRVVIVTGVQANGVETVLQAAVNNDKDPKYDVDQILSYVKNSENAKTNFLCVGGCIRLQGTSSLAYPIKNYRIYFKNASKVAGDLYLGCNELGIGGELQEKAKFSFRPDAQYMPAPVDCFCLKADFAESSSSHNTGMARMVQDVLIKANELTPPQKYVNRDEYEYDVRTTIDGEPCMLFYRATINDTPKFLGKFNFNNDKSTEAVFGFCDIPGYHDAEWVANKFGGENPTECWEFLNNDYPMGMFKDDDFDTVVTDDEGKTKPNWLNVFEARFPDDDDINAQYEAGTKKPIYLERLVKWVKSTDTTAVGLTELEKTTRRNKFKTELGNYFDIPYLCDYYTFTDVFACADQRVKNMMMAFWYNPDVDKMLAYMIFYDNDTILGVRNDGRLKYDWDVNEETIDPELSTDTKTVYAFAGHDSVLWKNLRDCFADELNEAYVRIRAALSNSAIFNYFDTEQSDKFCSRIYNIDALNKYIIPKTIGIDVFDENSNTIIKKLYSYMEAMQGSRKSHRHYFVTNRTSLFDAKASTGNYTLTDIVWKGNSAAGAKVTAVAAREFYFELKRESTSMLHSKVIAGEEWSYTYSEVANVGTVFHLLGGAWMKKLDLSDWGGFTDLQIPLLSVLEELILGNDNQTYTLTELVIGTNLPMLKKLIMKNYNRLPSLNLSSCTQLEYLDAGGCDNLSTLTFAESCPLSYFHIPSNYQTLILRSLPLIERSGLVFDNINSVSALWVENCSNLNGFELFQELFNLTNRSLTNVRITVNIEGDGEDLKTWYEARLGGLDANGNLVNNHCKICGDYQLTSYLEDEIYETYAEWFDELNIHQPQYTIIHSDDTIADDANFTNEDNKTGCDYNNEYVPSGHVKKILSQRFGCLGKQAVDGEMTICRLNDKNFNYYGDGTSLGNSTPASLTGSEGDAFVYEPHYWYKGVNDILGAFSGTIPRKYSVYSSNREMPDTPQCTIRTLDDIKDAGGYKKGYKVLLGQTSLTSAITTDSDYSYIKVDVTGFKVIRFSMTFGPLVGAIITDASDNIIDEISVASLDAKLIEGMYLLHKLPENATTIHFTISNSIGMDDVVLSNTNKVEDMEPYWVEHTECLVGMFEAIVIGNGLYSASANSEKAVTNQTQPIFSAYAATRKLQLIDWEMHKDIANLFFAKYGRRNSQAQCGYGQNITARIIGSSAFLGMTDTVNPNNKTEYAWYYNDEDELTQISCSRCMGYENLWGNVAEWMDKVELKSSEPYVFQITMPDGTVRKAKAASASGNYIKYIRHQRYMDVINVGSATNATQNTYYCDIFYIAGGNQVVCRSGGNAGAGGGVSCALASYGSSYAGSYIGCRLAFRGVITTAASVSAYKNVVAKY